MTSIALIMSSLVQDEGGATAVEYALLASVVAITAIAGLLAFGQSASNMWDSVSTTVAAALGS